MSMKPTSTSTMIPTPLVPPLPPPHPTSPHPNIAHLHQTVSSTSALIIIFTNAPLPHLTRTTTVLPLQPKAHLTGTTIRMIRTKPFPSSNSSRILTLALIPHHQITAARVLPIQVQQPYTSLTTSTLITHQPMFIHLRILSLMGGGSWI